MRKKILEKRKQVTNQGLLRLREEGPPGVHLGHHKLTSARLDCQEHSFHPTVQVLKKVGTSGMIPRIGNFSFAVWSNLFVFQVLVLGISPESVQLAGLSFHLPRHAWPVILGAVGRNRILSIVRKRQTQAHRLGLSLITGTLANARGLNPQAGPSISRLRV